MSSAVLLLGPEAVALAERLAASGYQPLTALDHDSNVDAALLSTRSGPPDPGAAAPLGSRSRCCWISATDSVEGRSRCLTAGADDYWLSSSPPSDLLTRLRLHLQLATRSTTPLPAPQVADLRVTPAAAR